MRKMGILAMGSLVRRGSLRQIITTSTFRRVLAMSRGLQTNTEIIPATSPDKKSMNFLWGTGGGSADLISIYCDQLINIIIITCTTHSGWAAASDC